MNILIGSDIHGSYKYGKLFFSKVAKYNPKKILLLGDLYYNGARNVPPEEYSPKDCVSLLNEYKDLIIATKGNCESEVDQWVSSFPILDMASLFIFDKEIILTHGHHYSFDNLVPGDYNIFIQGHTHIGVLERKDNLILANPGSISLPKDNHHSYILMNEEGMSLLDLIDDHEYKHISF